MGVEDGADADAGVEVLWFEAVEFGEAGGREGLGGGVVFGMGEGGEGGGGSRGGEDGGLI